MDLLNWLFDSSQFPARWHCGTWTSFEGWTHIICDVTVFICYMLIPIGIYSISKQYGLDREDRKTLVVFLGFIVFCGLNHLAEAVIFWDPIYRLSGPNKMLTALFSIATVIRLSSYAPRSKAKVKKLNKYDQIIDVFFDQSTIGCAFIGLDTRVIKVNDALCKIWRRDRDEILSDDFNWPDITHKDDLDADLYLLAELQNRERESYTIEKRYIAPDGSIIFAKLTVWRIDVAGKTLFYAITVEDMGHAESLRVVISQLRHKLRTKGRPDV